jgi:hypothetical protein
LKEKHLIILCINGKTNADAAWYYPVKRSSQRNKGYVAFGRATAGTIKNIQMKTFSYWSVSLPIGILIICACVSRKGY